MDRKAYILALIEQAFDGVSREGGVSLHEASAIDDGASSAERLVARMKDVDARWQDVPDEHIARSESVFSFVDIKGHVYYAPAYMSWLVRTGYDTESNSVDSAQYAFNPWGKHEAQRRYRPHDMFTPEQCHCIAQYLLYVNDVLDAGTCAATAQEYLDAYWSRCL